MGNQSQISGAQRQEAVLALLRREESAAALSRSLKVSEEALYRWRDQFLAGGEAALVNGKKQAARDGGGHDGVETKPLLTFFVPCLNEEGSVFATLEGIVAAASDADVSFEIFVVDDCSTDNTVEVVEAFQRQHPEVLVRLRINERTHGMGRNYVDSAFVARGEYYMLVCGDNSRAKDSLVAILDKLGEADMIIPYFGVDNRTWFRRFVSIVNAANP